MKTVEIFTDGACKGNPGPGGWGAILRMGKHEKELSGSEPQTTNNRMEMTAVIKALEGITKWVAGWKRNGWKNASKQPVRNADLWHELIAAELRHQVKWIWVRGHDGHVENERADKLASDAAVSQS